MTLNEMETFRAELLAQMPPADPPVADCIAEAYSQLTLVRRLLVTTLRLDAGNSLELAGLLAVEKRLDFELGVLIACEGTEAACLLN